MNRNIKRYIVKISDSTLQVDVMGNPNDSKFTYPINLNGARITKATYYNELDAHLFCPGCN